MNDKANDIAGEEVADETVAGPAVEADPEQRVTAAAAEPSGRTEISGGRGRRREGGSRLVSLFLFILLAGAAGTAGYFIFDLGKGRKANEARLQSQADRLEALQQGHDDLAADISRLAGRQAGMDDQVTGILRNMNNRRQQGGGATGWRFAEVEHLLRIASLRLVLAEDTDTAQAILLSADGILREIPDPGLIPVREQLIADINRLKSAPRTDLSGLALALGDLAAHARQLPIKPGAAAEQASAPDPGPDPTPAENRWRRLALGLWQELKSLLVISRTDGRSVALLSPGERFFLHQNLRLQLESARLAVLARDEDQLRSAANACRDWLDEFFDTGDNRVRNALDILESAAAADLHEPAPSIESTLHAFDDYRARRDRSMAGNGARQ